MTVIKYVVSTYTEQLLKILNQEVEMSAETICLVLAILIDALITTDKNSVHG